ncbi:nuclear pore membrane glycoprotein 210 [Pieris brassicae]|uniref:nuclear pore membrane glycoprotein 210 n=1 Tax=Pieris brassicae TaxID=7116 RepID=UPI001E662176|nr:nuclear pore membrane glycoprotein 210 [Pieris brassicae]
MVLNMDIKLKTFSFLLIIIANAFVCKSAKINTPRVLLPWFEDHLVNFTFEIIEGGCYTWSLSRDDIIDLEALYDDAWGHCSRSARVSVSKTCVPPGSVIILAEEVATGEILRGDVDIDKITSLKVMSTTWKLYLEEAPEAFEVVAYDDSGNKFSTLEGIRITWTVENVGSTYGDEPLVRLVRWSDTDYEAPRGVTDLESKSLQGYSVLLYGQAMGDARVTVCLDEICTMFSLQVVASVVLTPATAYVAPGDALKYRVVRARAGRLTVQDVAETLYTMTISESSIAYLEDSISLVRATELGTTPIFLMSGSTEVTTALLTVTEPHSIKVNIRPANLVIQGEEFIIHCILYDSSGHAITAGQDILIRLTVDGEADVDLLRSTENGTITDAIALKPGRFMVSAKLFSVAGRGLPKPVEGQASAVAVRPLQIVPPELFVAWTDSIQNIQLNHRGGGNESVSWSEEEKGQSALSLSNKGLLTVHGVGQLNVGVHLTQYSYIRASGRVWSAVPELVQVSSSGHARVGKPHYLHIALTATYPSTGELYNFHICDCSAFSVSLVEGPEPFNVTAVPWMKPVEGACCVLECWWKSRGISSVRVSYGRAGDTARVAVRAAPALLWPTKAAALVSATLPVLAEGEALSPSSSEARIAHIESRSGPPPHRHPDVQLFTMKCHRKGETRLEVSSEVEGEKEVSDLPVHCAAHVSKIKLEPEETPGNCSNTRVWLRPNQDVTVKVTLFDAVGRELLDENGPRVSWETQPNHIGIEYKATDRLFVEFDTEYDPVPVPLNYYQVVKAGENAIGWSGVLKANIPEATVTVQAKVVAPLKCEPSKVNIAWESEVAPNLATISGGSGRYNVETPKGVSASIDSGTLNAILPAPGTYDLTVVDQCVYGERQTVEVNIEEVLSVEVSTARAICVDACVPITALVKGVSHRYLTTSRHPEWRSSGNVVVKDGTICGVREGSGRVRAMLAGVWSPEHEVTVFPSLQIVPERSRLPPGARLQLRHSGGPPNHLATFTYKLMQGNSFVEVSQTGGVQGIALGASRIMLVAADITGVELATAEAEVEVVPISNLRVRATTQTLLVGKPGRVWIEAAGLGTSALLALHPPPKATWSLRDPKSATLYTTHAIDMLERSSAEGLSIRVVPLKAGVIAIDVRVRNMGQISDTRSWDSTIEILGVSEIRTSVDGLSQEMTSNRLSLAVGATVKLNSSPRSNWVAYVEEAFDLRPNGELIALKAGHGVAVVKHNDERNGIHRESMIHVEVSVPHYCTAEPTGEDESLHVVLRNSIGRELIAPQANMSVLAPHTAIVRRSSSGLGTELLLSAVDGNGAFMGFQSSIGGFTVTDEVWIAASETGVNRIIGTGSWAICLEGVGWRAPTGVNVYVGTGVSLAILTTDVSAKHVLRLDRPSAAYTLHQVPVKKMEFLPGEWPSSLIPLSIDADLGTGPLLCTEEQKYAVIGVEVQLPFSCRTKAPHTAQPVLDIVNGQLGCSVIPAIKLTQALEVDLCAEWGIFRACTKVLLLPPIHVSETKVSLRNPPAHFTIHGHPRAMKQIKMTTSPGLKLEPNVKDSEVIVAVKSESEVCGIGFVTIVSRLTSQELRVEVERECDIGCGTLLGALFSLLSPYIPTILTCAAIGVGYIYVQSKLQSKAPIRIPTEPVPTVLPETPTLRTRTWSRSPYASNGPANPIYGDASVLPDTSFSPLRPSFI